MFSLRSRIPLAPALAFSFALFCTNVVADALVQSSAMKAATIAQFYIEKEQIRLELEVGLEQLPAFANLLPDPIRKDMGLPAEPFPDRISRFFNHDLAIYHDGAPLAGRLTSIGPGKRIERDPITGSPVVIQGTEPETVIQATLIYHLPGQVSELIFAGPRIHPAPEIGFVVYHNGVAVNDFRYLGPNLALKLDWEDPWYTRFSLRNLGRAYTSPMSGFIYVESREVRKEIIVRPKDIQKFVDLGLEGKTTITAEMFPDLLLKTGEFLDKHLPLQIDGKPVKAERIRTNFLERTLTSSRIINPPEELLLDAALIGAIYVFPISALPDKVEMEWDLFHDKIDRISVASVDQAGPLPSYLERDFSTLVWENFLTNPVEPELDTLFAPATRMQTVVLYLVWPFALLTLVLLIFVGRNLAGRRAQKPVLLSLTVIAVVMTATSYLISHSIRLDEEKARQLVSGLLHNIYYAFDFRQDEQIYDVLAHSVDGELLSSIYRETKRGLELENQGGARAKVKSIELSDLLINKATHDKLRGTATWSVNGSVGHWGHIHSRVNQYQAEFIIKPVENRWKMTDLQVLKEERVR